MRGWYTVQNSVEDFYFKYTGCELFFPNYAIAACNGFRVVVSAAAISIANRLDITRYQYQTRLRGFPKGWLLKPQRPLSLNIAAFELVISSAADVPDQNARHLKMCT